MKLPRSVSGRRLAKALRRLGFVAERQTGSHLTMFNPRSGRTVVVPMHPEIRTGTLAAVLEDAGLTPEELRDAL